MLEGNTGGYVYSFALANQGFRSMSAGINLSKATINKGSVNEGIGSFIPYVYMNATIGINGVDLGLIYMVNTTTNPLPLGTGWYPFKQPSGGANMVVNRSMRFSADVTMNIMYPNNGSIWQDLYNVSTGVSQTNDFSASWVISSPQFLSLMAGTTLVPETIKHNGMRTVGDIKGGVQFRNVEWVNLRAFTSNNLSGTPYPITAASVANNGTNTIVVYDSDSTLYRTFGSNSHIVDIWYNPQFK